MNSRQLVYLKPNAVAEPLINRWYAWSYLVSPLTSALFLANHHLKVMRSFVNNPQLHAEALRRPEMRGGPFMHYEASRTEEIRSLLETTEREQADLIELANAVQHLHDLIANECGSSLEPLYAKLPAPLAGYVELVYDLQHRATFRILEPLLYASGYYKKSNQSLVLSLVTGDERAFALSTPRLEMAGELTLRLPFESAAIDELSRARRVPKPLGFFRDVLQVSSDSNIEPYFTTDSPEPLAQQPLAPFRLRYFGHACLLAETARTSVLFDPIIPYDYGSGMTRYGFDALPETINYVVITHSHQDHAVLETLLQLRHRVGALVVPANAQGNLPDPSLKLMFRQLGFPNVLNLDELEILEIEGGSIQALPFLGEHGDLDIRSKAAHLLRLGGYTLLCAADSNNVDPRIYGHLASEVGKLDALFIGMECQGAPMSWLYGPLLAKPVSRKHDQMRRLDGSDAEKALDIVERFKPARIFVYAMGAEPWLGFISSIRYDDESRPITESNRLIDECRRRGIPAERLYGCKEIVLSP